jgi:predicted DNA-binding transcriptional regulator AlpA
MAAPEPLVMPVKQASRLQNQPDLFSWEGQQAVKGRGASNTAVNRDSQPCQRQPTHGQTRTASYPAPRSLESETLASSSTPTQPGQHLLDVRAAAAWLGLSKSTLDKMRCYGVGPRYIRATCRAVRYDPNDLRAFVESRRQD